MTQSHFNQSPIYGAVLANEDPQQAGRLKLRVYGVNDNAGIDGISWSEREVGGLTNQHEVPAVGENVRVFVHPDGTFSWSHLDFVDKELLSNYIGDDYLTSVVLAYKNLKTLDASGVFTILWTSAEGLRIISDNASIQMKSSDSSIMLKSHDMTVHILEESISLGSEDESAEPALLGNKTEDALNEINDSIENHMVSLTNFLSKLSATAAANPYTSPLTSPITAAITTMKANTTAYKQAIRAKIDLIKSEIVNLD